MDTLAKHHKEDNLLIILNGCSYPEKIIGDIASKNIQIWVDRPLQLSKKEKESFPPDTFSNITLVHMDGTNAHFKSVV